MSAENAWEVAKKALADFASPTTRRFVLEAPMPPAFRAEVEAEELREALGRIRDETLLGVSHGLGDRIYSIASGALSRLEAKGESHE